MSISSRTDGVFVYCKKVWSVKKFIERTDDLKYWILFCKAVHNDNNHNILIGAIYRSSSYRKAEFCDIFDEIHIYIIGHYNPSVRIIDLVFHTTYVVCVNFINKWRDLLFKVDYERQIFWETFHGSFNSLSKFLPEICWEEIAEEILFVFCFDVRPGARILALRLISQHTTY